MVVLWALYLAVHWVHPRVDRKADLSAGRKARQLAGYWAGQLVGRSADQKAVLKGDHLAV